MCHFTTSHKKLKRKNVIPKFNSQTVPFDLLKPKIKYYREVDGWCCCRMRKKIRLVTICNSGQDEEEAYNQINWNQYATHYTHACIIWVVQYTYITISWHSRMHAWIIYYNHQTRLIITFTNFIFSVGWMSNLLQIQIGYILTSHQNIQKKVLFFFLSVCHMNWI